MMKLRFLVLILATALFSVVSFAQEGSFKIEISLKNTSILTNTNNSPIDVKIRNISHESLSEKKIKYEISLYLSKCGKDNYCGYQGDVFKAYTEIESKMLRQNKSFDFKLNLADFAWSDQILSFHAMQKNFTTVSEANYYLYAEVTIFDHYTDAQGNTKEWQLYNVFKSNEIVVNVNSK